MDHRRLFPITIALLISLIIVSGCNNEQSSDEPELTGLSKPTSTKMGVPPPIVTNLSPTKLPWLHTEIIEFCEDDWTALSIESGTKPSSVTSIAEDNKGNMWFGTLYNLHCYSGLQWKTFSTANGLACNDVQTIFKDKDGGIWVGGSRGISYFNGVNWSIYTVNDDWRSNFISAICQDNQGNLWFGSMDGTITRREGKSWWNLSGNFASVIKGIGSIFQDNAGKIWFFCHDGKNVYFDDGRWVTSTNIMTQIVTQDREGNIWGHVDNRQLCYLDGVNWNTYSVIKLPVAQIFSMFWDKQGRFWVNSMLDIRYYDIATGTIYKFESGLYNKLNRTIFEDSAGDFWFGSSDNLILRYSPHDSKTDR